MITKLARGHAFFDLSEVRTEEPTHIAVVPLGLLDPATGERFESPPAPLVWPEVGSRKFLVLGEGNVTDEWIDVQEGRYRYLAGTDGSVFVRIVLSEYLTCEVIW